MHYGLCLLCENMADLCDSHALPDALFRPLLRQRSGTAIHATDDATTPITLTSDSWCTPQLCAPCEGLMNDEWDRYGIAVFKGRAGKARRMDAGVSFVDVDAGRLRMFLLAVLWRMSVSVHKSYLSAHVPPPIREELRHTLLSRGRYPASRLHVSLQRLHDSTPGGFTSKAFRNMVMSPFIREHGSYYSIGFTMFGFLAQVFLPALPSRLRPSTPLLGSKGRIVFAPRLEFTHFPELFDLGVRALHKTVTGLSHVVDR
jgi:hypothetical protein